MTTEVIAAVRRAIEPLRTRVPLSGAEWANTHFYLSPESSGTEGRWRCYPYQVAWLDWMTSDDIEEVNFQKSRRVGYTKCLMAATGCLIEQKNRNVAIWHPTDGDAKDFVTDEIDTLLRDVDALGKKLKCTVGSKNKHNTLEKKSFHGATLDIKGGKSARNFRRMTKDVAIYDETDGFDSDIDGEGSCFELGDGRLDQAPFPKSIRGSTPKTKGISLIETAVENSDRVFWRFVKCPDCGTLQRLEFSGLAWDEGQPETAHYKCVNGCVLYYRQYPGMDAAGRWQTLDGYYYDEKRQQFFNPDNERISKPRKIGVRIWAGYSYLRPWSYMVDRWLDATKNAKIGNVTTLKTVINTLLGETFEEEGVGVDASSLDDRGEDYLHGDRIPNDVLVITVGADVQGGLNSRIEFEFVGHGLEGESWSLGYHVLSGDPERREVWDNLEDHLLRRFIREDGVSLAVSAAFIDSGYLATEVYRFTGPRRKRGVFATKGVNTGTICNKGTWQGDKSNKSRCILRTVNVDDAKTIIFNRLQITEPGPGYCHFPSHYTDKHFEQLTNEEKVEKHKRGSLVGYEWRKKGPNEQLDCRAYALGALEYLNPNMGRLKLRLEKRAAAAMQDVTPEESEVQEQKQRQRRQRTRKRGFVQGW
jgi:phage terminase large subunit GpA-like protein